MAISFEQNITCPLCRFRHLPSLTCAQSAARALANSQEKARIAALDTMYGGSGKFVSTIPEGAGDIVAICVHNGRLYIATQFSVFWLNERQEGGKLMLLQFESHE